MRVLVKFPVYLRALTQADQAVIDVEARGRLSDLLRALTRRYGERFIDLLHTSELGHTPIWASVKTDGEDILIDDVAQSNWQLSEGSEVVLLGPVGGG